MIVFGVVAFAVLFEKVINVYAKVFGKKHVEKRRCSAG